MTPTAAAIASAKPTPPAPKAAPSKGNDMALELGGGAAAVLALGGAAFAITRRRRKADEAQDWYSNEEYAEPVAATEPQPAETGSMRETRAEAIPADQPETAGRSAFAWGDRPAPEDRGANSDDDRRPGETWVERAYRGPTPNNPSVSLRHRLKRAAFFDKREREVAEGRAAPMDPGAGLPEAATTSERELVAG
jgi:hypothetical protein